MPSTPSPPVGARQPDGPGASRRRGPPPRPPLPLTRPARRSGPLVLVAVLVLLTAGAAADARAQAGSEASDRSLSGVVVTGPEERPLPGARVRLVGAPGGTVTDSAGRFVLTGLSGPSIRLSVLHRGVRTGPVRVEAPAGAELRIRVAPGAVSLPEIEVTVERRSEAEARLAGFHRRLRRGDGHFLTAEQIARRDPGRLSHMFRALPGLTVVRREFGGTVVSDRPDCRLEFFVDGVRSSFLRVDALRPGDVAGIEVYHGSSRVPPRFVRPDYCGAVVVWTRVPGDSERP